MAYTRPTYNSDNITWAGKEAYSRPAYNAADVSFQEGLTPQIGSIAITGQSPTLAFGVTLMPTQCALATVGEAPTVAYGLALSPSQGSIAVEGEAPKTHLDALKAHPSRGAVTTSGQTPALAFGKVLTPTQRTITLSGLTPTTLIRQAIPAYLTGQGFSTQAQIFAQHDIANIVLGGSFTQAPGIFGGALVTGSGFKTNPTLTAFGAETAYVTGQGFSTQPAVTAISVSVATVQGQGFAQTVRLFGGAEVYGSPFRASLTATGIAPESANVTGAMFSTNATVVGQADNIARVLGGAFLSGLAYSAVEGRTIRTEAIIKAEFDVTYAEAYVMGLVPVEQDARNVKPVFPVTRYQNFPFLHITRIRGKYYGVSQDGLYELSGDTDGPTVVSGTILTNEEDISVFNSKNVPYIYLNGDDDYSVIPVVDDVAQPVFNTGFSGRRARLARGMKGRYWYFRISGIRRLQGLEYTPDSLSRKVK